MKDWRTILGPSVAVCVLGLATIAGGRAIPTVKGTLLDAGPGYVIIDSGGPQRLPLSPSCRISVHAFITADEIVAGTPCQVLGTMKAGATVIISAILRFNANGQRQPDATRFNTIHNGWDLAYLNCVVLKNKPLTLKVQPGNKYYESSRAGLADFQGQNLDGQTLTVDMTRFGPESLRVDFGNALEMAGTKAEAEARIETVGLPQPLVVMLIVRRTEPLPQQKLPPVNKRKRK